MTIRALIVDDEPLARERLRSLVAGEADIEVIAECSDGAEAARAIERLSPDLVFLDIQMPELDGFAVLEAIEPELVPVIIFVTAYDEYAIRAFDVHALDYLLKPFDRARFHRALSRARAELMGGEKAEGRQRLAALLAELPAQGRYLKRIVVKSGGRVVFLSAEEIDWIEAAGNYVKLHVGEKSHLLRETMKRLEEKLEPQLFVRIHRSHIVNVDRVRELEPWFNGEFVVVLKSGAKLTSGRAYGHRLRQLLANEP
jgi:two-component system LytT family response regulator